MNSQHPKTNLKKLVEESESLMSEEPFDRPI